MVRVYEAVVVEPQGHEPARFEYSTDDKDSPKPGEFVRHDRVLYMVRGVLPETMQIEVAAMSNKVESEYVP
jgi:hypothetical protein